MELEDKHALKVQQQHQKDQTKYLLAEINPQNSISNDHKVTLKLGCSRHIHESNNGAGGNNDDTKNKRLNLLL